jgi:radical SAM protein with 4Fe4S-binding SPASM domain
MCPNKELKKEDKGYLDLSLYKKIINESQDFIFDVNLAHRGESLLHPQVAEMIDYAKKRNVFTRLHTNGSLLTEKKAYEIIQAGLDRLSFSFDGYDKETYERIRERGDFDKTITNIIRFLEIKKTTGKKKPVTAIEVIDFGKETSYESAGAKKEFMNNFRNLPLNDLAFKELHNWAGEIEKKKYSGEYLICPFPWNALIIYWDGSVLPCTQDFFGYYVLGNVKDSSLKEIWNNEKMVNLRKKLITREIEELNTCSNCDRLRRKGFLGVPREYLWKFIAKRMP